ncbi:MAG: alpha-ketoglutarate-dependent dioxygenase AlkB [Patescibacteria group bacterium]|nr:alpha-ketoglutarate-dependent dioxygenase AlkB [Patescibacteria group bacterium]MDE1945349.1 alpha-ketoglutarate-dependent dioxygenase AlkB [Patescibacteria group bacterium]MDE2058024.1 alpha-ketoglutarate-dependent dioxygenase AlkB [Patescibacteria group bacterium]
MKRAGSQYKLFETAAALENGLRYRPEFITEDEEEALLVWIGGQDLEHARGGEHREYAAKRRHKSFGWGYDHRREAFVPGPPLPPFLGRFARRIEKWLALPRGRVVEALINEYTPGAGLGWHNDREPFEHIVGISLAGWVKMRFRPYADKPSAIGIELEPRSVYVMQGPVRADWQHAVAPARTLRYSITFRTLPSSYRLSKRHYTT